MKIEGNTIEFKSTQHNWIKEFNGVKPNTIEHILKHQGNKIFPNAEYTKFMISKHELEYIKIINQESNDSFIRKLTDITICDFDITLCKDSYIVVVFSWEIE